MKKLFRLLFIAGGLFVLFTCQMENNALDEPLTPAEASPLSKMSYAKWPDENVTYLNTISGVAVTACCGQGHQASSGDGDAANAIDGLTAAWWHPNWSSDTSGHTSDTAAWSEGGAYTHVNDYINEVTTDPAASGVQNGQGGHWITLDLGVSTDNLAALAYLSRSQADRTIRGFEIYVSDTDIKWDVSNATLVSRGVWGNEINSYHYARFEPVTARYIQIRQLRRIGGATSTGDYGCVVDLQVETSMSGFPGLDKSILTSAYVKGTVLLKTLDPSTARYRVLSQALETAFTTINDPNLEEFPLAGQSSIDAAADTLLAVINAIDPPRKPPED